MTSEATVDPSGGHNSPVKENGGSRELCFLSLWFVFQAAFFFSAGCAAHGVVVEKRAFHKTECLQLDSVGKVSFLSHFDSILQDSSII